MTKSKVKISKEMAEAEVRTFLEAHYIDVDTEDMEEEEASTMGAIISALARPIKKGRATIDGKKYTLELLDPQGDLKEVSFEGMNFHALTYAGRAKSGDGMAMEGHVIAAMCKVTYAELCKMTIQDWSTLNNLKKVFMSA
ncbi:hypothetical protein NVP1181O_23 [Vibrio phage 1.181.O._10N.286.46.C9]|nr:hypothetical protein NVP1181O_23 [Vibrio phage 1.181.O._10N.286.46.C9]